MLAGVERIDLHDVERLARMGEDKLATLVLRLEYFPADAPAHSPMPRDLMILDIAIHIRATTLAGGPVSAEPQWLELAYRQELAEAAQFVREISASGAEVGLRIRR